MIKILIIMKLKLLKNIVCRTPTFGTEDLLGDVWEDLKQKIKESSPTFYQSIKEIKSEELDSLDGKARFTIWKYFKQTIYRATPFESFSAINLASIA